jgi:chemotaxis protein methyltransferase CheR
MKRPVSYGACLGLSPKKDWPIKYWPYPRLQVKSAFDWDVIEPGFPSAEVVDMPISPQDFEFLGKLIRQRAGIVLDPGKEYLLESRLEPLAKSEGFQNLAALAAHVRSNPNTPVLAKITDAMTTNETSFFRDFHPFEALRTDIFPALFKERLQTRELNVWCAAASSGQEPYSVAMVLMNHFAQYVTEWKIQFVATDISPTMLERCRGGIYSQLEINRGLPAPLLIKHFTKQPEGWQLKEPLRKLVQFKPLNLLEAWPPLPTPDIVFIRNVLI